MDTLSGSKPMEKPPHAPLAGLDPADLLRQGVAEDTFASAAAFQPPSLEELTAIFPQFEILELIGKGGMGAVYKVRQKDLDRIVALKILPPAIGQSPEFSNRFTREARALAKLNHPGIVTLHEFGQEDGLYFILMEFVNGVNLAQLMKTGRISPREALAIVPQICDALQFAHDQGIVHRDIKPENILLDRLGRVKVADFGIAKVVASVCDRPAEEEGNQQPSQTDATLAGKIIGTPAYMAPEQFDHPAEVDHRADIYALGVVFFQMLTGDLPAKRLEAPSKKVHIDVRLDEIVLKAMEKNPELRYQQASVMKTRVDDLGADPRPPGIRGQGDQAQTVNDPRQRFLWYGTIVSMIVLVFGIVARMPEIWTLALCGFILGGQRLGLFPGKGKVGSREDFQPGGASHVEPAQEKPKPPWGSNASSGKMIAIGCGVLALVVGIGLLATGTMLWFRFVFSKDDTPPPAQQRIEPAGPHASSTIVPASAAEVTGNIVLPKEYPAEQKQRAVDAALALLASCSFTEAGTGSEMFNAGNGVSHLKITFPTPKSADTPDQMLITFPLTSGSVWTRRGDRFERHAKFSPAAAAALSAALGHPPSAAFAEAALGATDAEVTKEVIATAGKWLVAIDAQDYAQSWKHGAKFFQTSITEAGWSEALTQARKPLGEMKSRKLMDSKSAKSLPGAPDGEYVVMQFQTSFAAKEDAVETVTFVKENDGTWKAAGYFVR